MANTRIKPLNQRPYDPAISQATGMWMDQMTVLINNLVGQQAPSSVGLPTVQNNIVNPTTSQMASGGSRTTSITTQLTFVATTTGITVYWDGTNGSVPFQIYRDDGTITNAIYGHLAITGLSASTQYYLYPYYDEGLQLIEFAGVQNVSVGTPAVAFTAQNVLAVQAQALRNRIPLAVNLSTTGATTPSTGTTSGSGGNGGGAGRGGMCPIVGTLLHPLSGPINFRKEPETDWIQLHLVNGLVLTATPAHPVFSCRGKLRLDELKPGDLLITYKGEVPVDKVKAARFDGEKLVVEVPQGHLYWANGILSHNVKI